MNDTYKDVVEKNLEYFSKTLDEFKDEHLAVAQSKISHLKRFEKMLELGDFQGKSLLDVGCGIGGFYDFLREKGIDCRYTGIDINAKMINKARERHSGTADNFFVFDIIERSATAAHNATKRESSQKKSSPENNISTNNSMEGKLNDTFDFVISVGPLNLEFAPGLNMQMTMRLIKEMVDLSKIGAAISMTSALTKKPAAGTFYYDPAEVLTKTAEFCANARYDHTYLPHDFTLFCYKRDLYS